MKKQLIAPAIAALLCTLAAGTATAQSAAAEGPWMVRVRAVHLDSANKDSTGLNLSVNDKWLPEVDISYFVTPNIAAELILTVPQKQDVTLSGAKIGTFKHLPPTLTVQYHFLPDGMVRPYVGAGVNYTRISSVALNVPGVGDLDLESSSLGGALQVGVDVKVADNLFVNLDVKKVWISSDVMLKSTGAKVSSVTLDPIAFSVGIGYRF